MQCEMAMQLRLGYLFARARRDRNDFSATVLGVNFQFSFDFLPKLSHDWA